MDCLGREVRLLTRSAQTFNSRNFLEWMADFENKLKLKSISTQLMCVAIAKDVIIEQVQEFASREVNGGTSARKNICYALRLFI
jgi:hypothetical protein